LQMQGTHKSKKSSTYRCLKISNFYFVIDEKKEGASLITTHPLCCYALLPATSNKPVVPRMRGITRRQQYA
uniref:hypothetical protein n=1 Tax=Prevotella sp. TaxID=59823 RepID=UPI003FEE7EED